MKRSLFVLLLAGVLLAGAGCSKSPAPVTTEPDSTQATTEKAEEITVTTEPATETTETVPTTTEAPTTEAPTEPASTAPQTTTPTKPAEVSKPSELTKPITPTQSPQTTKPTQPAETTAPTTQATKPTEAPKPTEPTTTAAPTTTQPDLSGWVEKDGKRYYQDADGSLHTGWLSLNGERYYFHEDCTMAVGKVKVPGSGTRYFTSTGKECILVNPWNYVPSDYSVKLSKYKDYKVATVCLSDLKEMISDCKSSGSKAVVVSAYRSHSYQAGLYERRVQRFIDQGYSREEAEIEAAKRVAIPGTSEHELGLAVDIVDVNYQDLDKEQENTAAQKWLMANSWKYGFILRYPNSKSGVTGIIYEPWHYRYVGKELAKELHSSGQCLEEYFASLS
jgi:hypothetical protein